MVFPISPLKQEVFRVALPHFALISLSLFYVVTGAYLFRAVEPPLPSINSTLSAVQSNLIDELLYKFKIKHPLVSFETNLKLSTPWFRSRRKGTAGDLGLL